MSAKINEYHPEATLGGGYELFFDLSHSVTPLTTLQRKRLVEMLIVESMP